MYLALPQNLEDVESILDYGTAHYNVRDSVKSIEWLEENGLCLDNIKPGISSIPHAGYGAFATRHIAKGDVVAPAPLVQLNHFQMLMMESSEQEDSTAEVFPVGNQLLMNYVFGNKGELYRRCFAEEVFPILTLFLITLTLLDILPRLSPKTPPFYSTRTRRWLIT